MVGVGCVISLILIFLMPVEELSFEITSTTFFVVFSVTAIIGLIVGLKFLRSGTIITFLAGLIILSYGIFESIWGSLWASIDPGIPNEAPIVTLSLISVNAFILLMCGSLINYWLQIKNQEA
jgi:hypothetical protein